jgi:hypothetical protein
LKGARREQGAPARQQRARVHLEADHEEEEGEAEVGDGLHVGSIVDEAEAHRTEQYAGPEQRGDGGHAQPLEQRRQQARREQAQAQLFHERARAGAAERQRHVEREGAEPALGKERERGIEKAHGARTPERRCAGGAACTTKHVAPPAWQNCAVYSQSFGCALL